MIDQELEIYYPGRSNPEEQKLVDALAAQVQAVNEAAAQVVLEELPLVHPADAFELLLYNKMLLPETRLYTDEAYAEKAGTWGSSPLRTFGTLETAIPISPALTDILAARTTLTSRCIWTI